MTIAVELEGATGTLIKAEGERYQMTATRAYAPGTPLKAKVLGSTEVLDLKVARSVRRSDGAFEVEGRLVNLTRTQRALLDERLSPSS